jgi:DNA end-binding protein Ku
MAAKSGRTRGAKSVPDDIAHEDGNEPRARAFWSGTITFGLVSIPVELFPAHRSLRVPLRMVDEEGTPLVRRYVCPKDGKHLDRHEIVRGFPVEKDEYVVLTDEELERLAPERTRDIDLRQFVPVAQLDPLYFERGYYLTPGGRSTKAYRLLAGTMEETGRAGIATFVMRGKEYLIAIVAERGILRAETLRFADELRTPADLGLPEPAKPQQASVRKIAAEIRKRVERSIPDRELADPGSERMLVLVRDKQERGEGVFAAPGNGAPAELEERVVDLMEALKRSMREADPEGSSGRRRASRSGAARGGRKDDAKLDAATKEELYERAKQLDIPKRSGMTKRQLIEAIRRSA